jgi:Leucine-rich repeat (LRR) protein
MSCLSCFWCSRRKKLNKSDSKSIQYHKLKDHKLKDDKLKDDKLKDDKCMPENAIQCMDMGGDRICRGTDRICRGDDRKYGGNEFKHMGDDCKIKKGTYIELIDSSVTDEQVSQMTGTDPSLSQLLVRSCPNITKVPSDLSRMMHLESITFQCCEIPVCVTGFPTSLRTLDLSYCGLRTFEPACFERQINLVELNLSFNKLSHLPLVLKTLHSSTRVSVQNNNLWFDMYSAISDTALINGDIHEIHLAFRLNKVSTRTMERRAKLVKEEAAGIVEIIAERKGNRLTTYDNKENVHIISVQDTLRSSIDFIKNEHHDITASRIKTLLGADKDKGLGKEISHVMSMKENVKTIHGISLSQLLMNVCGIIETIVVPESRQAVRDILASELEGITSLCLTGQITRIASSLNGFVPGVSITLGRIEEMSNAIIVLRHQNAKLYKDTEEYISNTYPAVLDLLETACVPVDEQAAWLEYV